MTTNEPPAMRASASGSASPWGGSSAPSSDSAPTESLFENYAPLRDAFDECMTAEGAWRPHWELFLRGLDQIGPAELRQRWEQARAQVVRDGLAFDALDPHGTSTRPWMPDAIPMMADESEWNRIAAALNQRARLLDAILSDLFGPQRLIREKILPPEVLYSHPAYQPSYHELNGAAGRRVLLYAADLARNPAGDWWVAADYSRAPFGLGFVLENRIVASRMVSSLFRQCRVQRLASFFVALMDELRRLAPRFKDNPRIMLLSEGPSGASYLEDSYLARYLGYTLVEGADLAVRDARVMWKTLGGLLPVEVVLRRLNDEDSDPLELNQQATSGVSGLVEVIRGGRVAVANSLGSRLAESPLLMAFLPSVCRFLFGEELMLPSVATWWCGQPEPMSEVLRRLDELLIRPAFDAESSPPVYPARLNKTEREALIGRLKESPHEFVAQEIVRRSTAPVWTSDGAEPWHVAWRIFLLSRDAGYEALPGGLARVSPDSFALDQSISPYERIQDVWVPTEGPIDHTSLLTPSGQPVTLRRSGSELPSRVADHLFWLGRYTERAEHSARLLRVVWDSLASETSEGPQRRPMLRVLAEQGQIDPDYALADFDQPLPDVTETLPAAMFDASRPMSLQATINNASKNAWAVRDRLAIDMWRIIDNLDRTTRASSRAAAAGRLDVMAMLEQVHGALVGFAGLAAESMTRTLGWTFLDLGRRIERSWLVASMLRTTFVDPSQQDEPAVMHAILRMSDSLMTYRNRYLATLQLHAVLDLLLTDDTNPRSIGFQFNRMIEHLNAMPRSEHQATMSSEQKLALAMQNAVRLADVHELSEPDDSGRRELLERLLKRLVDQLPKLSNAIESRYLIHAGLPRHYAAAPGRTSASGDRPTSKRRRKKTGASDAAPDSEEPLR